MRLHAESNAYARTVVIPCAGEGLRLKSRDNRPKCLLKIHNKTILEHIVRFWSCENVKFIVVARKGENEIERVLKKIAAPYRTVLQDKPTGVVDAILRAEKYLGESFAVHLGDCVLSGKFLNTLHCGAGVWLDADKSSVHENYGVIVHNNRLTNVEEKPRNSSGYQCGMGVYFFDKKIFELIKKMKQINGKREITDVLAKCLEAGYPLKPVFFKGKYFNINTAADLKAARNDYHKNVLTLKRFL